MRRYSNVVSVQQEAATASWVFCEAKPTASFVIPTESINPLQETTETFILPAIPTDTWVAPSITIKEEPKPPALSLDFLKQNPPPQNPPTFHVDFLKAPPVFIAPNQQEKPPVFSLDFLKPSNPPPQEQKEQQKIPSFSLDFLKVPPPINVTHNDVPKPQEPEKFLLTQRYQQETDPFLIESTFQSNQSNISILPQAPVKCNRPPQPFSLKRTIFPSPASIPKEAKESIPFHDTNTQNKPPMFHLRALRNVNVPNIVPISGINIAKKIALNIL